MKNWNFYTEIPKYDGEYLTVVLQKEECDAVYQKRRVRYFHMGRWGLKHNEVLTHWKEMDEMPSTDYEWPPEPHNIKDDL